MTTPPPGACCARNWSGWAVCRCSRRRTASARWRETTPDLIVLDVGLPRLDGFEVVDILRQGKGRATPLIVFTGRELSLTDQRQLTLGMTRHLTKARSSEDELVSSVRELLNGLLARRDAAAAARKAFS
jgi:CheY-like chemotaxis protein